MLALSSYDPERDSGTLLTALIELMGPGDSVCGLKVSTRLSELRAFVCFVWPDWPGEMQGELATKVAVFQQHHPELRRIDEGSPEWQAVFRDWRTDPESVGVIAEAFSKYFGKQRVEWVESERDARGRIAARCKIKDAGEFSLDLFWRGSSAAPPATLSGADRDAFQAGIRTVFQWASSRIRPILETLHDKLEALYGDRFRGLYVFGSYARPDAGIELPEDSDLDVALILSDFENPVDELDRFGPITSDLSLAHGIVISVVPIREADYREGRTNFIRVISEDAIRVG